MVDASPRAVDYCQLRFSSESAIVVHQPHVVSPDDSASTLPHALQQLTGSCQLIVSELFGSFGDNEFLPEIVSAAVGLWAAQGCLTIPREWSCFVGPIAAPSLKGLHPHKTYVLQLPKDAVLLAPLQLLYTGHCAQQAPAGGRVHFKFSRKRPRPSSSVDGGSSEQTSQSDDRLVGCVGYFTAVLWPGVVIDTRQTAGHERSCFHWESFLFPAAETDSHDCGFTFELRRRGGQRDSVRGMWYEWRLQSDVAQPSESLEWHNSEGRAQMMWLAIDCVCADDALADGPLAGAL